MNLKAGTSAAWVAVGFVFLAASIRAWDLEAPDDPAAHEAAKMSLAAMGSDRGARSLHEDIREIEGLDLNVSSQGRALVATVEQLDQAIEDLDAQVNEMEISVALSADVLFDFDSADIKPAAATELQNLGLIIREKRSGEVRITGHTDSVGSVDYNMDLSLRRAESVKRWLVTGVPLAAALIVTSGRGEADPVAPNTLHDGSDNTEGRRENRRVEIVIQTSGAVE